MTAPPPGFRTAERLPAEGSDDGGPPPPAAPAPANAGPAKIAKAKRVAPAPSTGVCPHVKLNASNGDSPVNGSEW